jgi:hypothetical protein
MRGRTRRSAQRSKDSAQTSQSSSSQSKDSSTGSVIEKQMQDPLDELVELRSDCRAFSANIAELTRALDQQGFGQTQTFEVKTSMGGFATGVAVASCVVTLVVMLAFIVIENRSYAHLDNQVDQLRAWNDVHSKEIARLQAQLQEKH